ncbi:DUF364 domain-containing protein [uncultured Thermanaerothrix sp.]|uniref:DUF364 domain-containing protein n=1 Tax=uncultured Thermanaerothrix sp. TaxID=1195149 RepID=UPI00261A2096|nr:DUF364 domain-containing protein [uncultured Thermanaerothrix sp.]
MIKSHLLETLLADLPSSPVPVRGVYVGVHWTLVCSRRCGLAATLTDAHAPHGYHRVRDVGQLHTKDAQELATWLLSENPLEASIGLAAYNSLLPLEGLPFQEINAAEVLKHHGAGRNVVIVGHFPFINDLRPLARNLWVLELHPAPGDLPATAASEILPQADVVAITATTLINHTVDDLLALCTPQAWRMLLGPSTPLTPRLFEFGFAMLSGACVEDENAALLTIQQGAVFPQVQGVRLLTLARENVNPDLYGSGVESRTGTP